MLRNCDKNPSRCPCILWDFYIILYHLFKIPNISTPVLRSSGKDRKGQLLSSSKCSHVLFKATKCVRFFFGVLIEGPKGEGKGESKGAVLMITSRVSDSHIPIPSMGLVYSTT